MIDPKLLNGSEEEQRVLQDLFKARGYTWDILQWQHLEKERKTIQMQTQADQQERNAVSKKIGQCKAQGQEEQASALLAQMQNMGDRLSQQEQALNQVLQSQRDILLQMPNLPHVSVPLGSSEEHNQEVARYGEKPVFSFPVLDHVSLGEGIAGLDLESARFLSGARFSVLKGPLALLHRALAQWMLELHTKDHGYTEVQAPLLVRGSILEGTGQLPKLAEDMFRVEGERDLYLIPTSEVTLTSLVADSILEEAALPLKFVSHTPCFRSEAGSYGKDTRGLFRVHQFEKVECVWIVKPEDSYAALESLRRHAEAVLQQLELPYRVMALCRGDMGVSAAKTYDLEVWLPGQNTYREISSCSNTEAFQARRMKARYRVAGGKPEYVHTLNGSGLAVGRTLIAVMENYQQEDGSIRVPAVLAPWMQGIERIRPQK